MAKYLSCTQPAPKTKFLYAANVVVMTASATKPLGKAAKKAFLVGLNTSGGFQPSICLIGFLEYFDIFVLALTFMFQP